MDDDDLLAELLPRLTRLSAALSRGRLIERAMAAAGVGAERPALSVLVTLHTADRPLRIGEIAARMEVVGPHVTRLVAGLEQRGLVRRGQRDLSHSTVSARPSSTPRGANPSARAPASAIRTGGRSP